MNFNNHFLDHPKLIYAQLRHVTVLWKENGKVSIAYCHFYWLNSGCVKCRIIFIAIGFRLCQFINGQTRNSLLTFQSTLYVNILLVCLITIFVLNLSFIFRNYCLYLWVNLVHTVGDIGISLL